MVHVSKFSRTKEGKLSSNSTIVADNREIVDITTKSPASDRWSEMCRLPLRRKLPSLASCRSLSFSILNPFLAFNHTSGCIPEKQDEDQPSLTLGPYPGTIQSDYVEAFQFQEESLSSQENVLLLRMLLANCGKTQ